MRPLLVRLHRWFGLFAAVFLFIAGLTGAVISWDHELDEWLNPHLFHAPTPGQPQPSTELAARLEAADPRLRVRYLPLSVEPGHSLGIFVEPRIDPASGKLFELGFNQVALDPVSGAVLGQREWGALSLQRENVLPFLYKLHYSMHIPDGFGLELGVLLMGILALAWVVDCLIALALSFPSRAAWRRSFSFRWRAGGYRLNFDLHRSGGVWLFPLLLILAVTSVAMNLREEVVRPLLARLSLLSPSPFADRAPAPPNRPVEPLLGFGDAIRHANAEATRRGWQVPAGGVMLSSAFGVYGVGFFDAGSSHGDGGLGNPWLYFDARDGTLVGSSIPGEGSAGDIFLQAMFPLHSGRIAGLPGRILVSLCGLAVAGLSVTGVVIWARKHKARNLKVRASSAPRAAASA
ncbi:PepSY domain-containing protein [Zoogloea sp. LCSB751]|uniref:PepSY-associated TM helix domain-containing protein n=1 Tax=Zoogloea sp. LCSB751 TaxID=1965277 RepID=UPI0009A48CF5|nr:PepSY-associated TM helix domain-containing protein [Zoogloea sp. LCSB751]